MTTKKDGKRAGGESKIRWRDTIVSPLLSSHNDPSTFYLSDRRTSYNKAAQGGEDEIGAQLGGIQIDDDYDDREEGNAVTISR